METFSVRVSGGARQGYAGRLSNTGDASLNGPRDVRGESCDDVLDALAFVAALGLERSAASTAREQRAAEEQSSLKPDTAGAAASPEDARASSTTSEDTAAEQTAPEETVPRDTLTRGAVAFAQLQPGLTPDSALELGAAFRLAWSMPALQPLLLVGVYAGVPRETRMAGGGRVRFVHWSFQWIGCPWRFPRQGRFALRPCLELELGRSSGEAFGLDDAAKYAAPWGSAGAQLRAELVLGEHWELGATIDAVVPFWHSHFYLVPDQMVFETPGFGMRGGAFAGLVF